MKIIYITLGLICLVLASIGVVLPILPTTPFLLVSAFCFARGSQRLNNWFIQTKLYKKHLESFTNEKSMSLSTKMFILLFASIMMLLAFYFMSNIYGRITIIIVISLKYYYFIYKIDTKRKNTDVNQKN